MSHEFANMLKETLETMKNKQVKYPCYGASNARLSDGRLEHEPNDYDMLWLNNLKQVLGSHFWLWPLPFGQEHRG